MKILSIGNSFSADAHVYLHSLAKERGIDLDTVNFDLYYKDGQLYDTEIEGSTHIHSSKFPSNQD